MLEWYSEGRCTSYGYPSLSEKAIIGGTAPPPYHSGKELILRPPPMRNVPTYFFIITYLPNLEVSTSSCLLAL